MVVQFIQTALAGCAVAETVCAQTVEMMLAQGFVEGYAVYPRGASGPQATLLRFLTPPPTHDVSSGIVGGPGGRGNHPGVFEGNHYFFAPLEGRKAWKFGAVESGADGIDSFRVHEAGDVVARLGFQNVPRRPRVFHEAHLPRRGRLEVLRFSFPWSVERRPKILLAPKGRKPFLPGANLVPVRKDDLVNLVGGRQFVIPAGP